MFKKIDHINISVTDIEESKKFFIDLLGFRLEKEGELKGEWIENVVGLQNVKAIYARLFLPNTETFLELIEYRNPVGKKDEKISRANKIGFRHLAFEVKDIEKIYKKLKKEGVKFLSEIQVNNNQKKLCYFLGPDGIILELAEYN